MPTHNQAPLYHDLEELDLWAMEMCDRLPKGMFSVQHRGIELLHEITEAKTACDMAYQTTNLEERMELLAALTYHLTNVKSVTKILYLWSSRTGQTVRLISIKQHGAQLQIMTKIGSQLGRWMKSTEASLASGATAGSVASD